MTLFDEREEKAAAETAAYWFARLRAEPVSAADRASFLRWLNAAPANESAYRLHQTVWDDLADIAGDETVLALRNEALARAPAVGRWNWQYLGAIAATLLLFAITGVTMLGRTTPPSSSPASPVQLADAGSPTLYRTAVGDRSAVTLEDGSQVELNTDSVIQVDFSRGRRDVRLLRGQALFDVAHDADRPFIVEAAGQQVTAIGTSFDIRVEGGEMRVTLIEGKVAVAPARASPTAGQQSVRMLAPGEQLVAAVERPVTVQPANVDQATSWRSGRVIFADEPLQDVVEEVNRYSQRKIVVADSAAGRIRVSGVFRAGSIGSFVTALDAAFPIAAEQGADGILLRSE